MWLSLRQVADEYSTTVKTVAEWIDRGILTPDGDRVKLKAPKIGGVRKTRRAWLDEFLVAINGGELPALGNPAAEQKQRTREKEACARALAR